MISLNVRLKARRDAKKKEKKKGCWNSWKRRDPIFSPLGHARVEGVAIAKKKKKKTADFAQLADRHIGVKLGIGQREKYRKRWIVGRKRKIGEENKEWKEKNEIFEKYIIGEEFRSSVRNAYSGTIPSPPRLNIHKVSI